MRLVQFRLSSGELRVGRESDGQIVDLTNPDAGLHSTLDLIEWAERERADLPAVVSALGSRIGESYSVAELTAPTAPGSPLLTIPLQPPEVWGCGVTYQKSAAFRDEETGRGPGIYDYVYSADRPEIFFKATAARCVGSREPIVVRSDSRFTAPEPELAIVVDSLGRILGYTVADDVSAWDIERENPLYLPQSKVFAGCCALGPVLVTADEIPDPYGLVVICRIYRDGATIFDDRAETSRIRRRLDDLVAYLRRDNPIPAGTVVLTGTGVIASAEHALREGDVVEIEIPGIGILSNPVVKGRG
jgi:2-dehydro-3-deoxy-D-arabinonate dehydratase